MGEVPKYVKCQWCDTYAEMVLHDNERYHHHIPPKGWVSVEVTPHGEHKHANFCVCPFHVDHLMLGPEVMDGGKS